MGTSNGTYVYELEEDRSYLLCEETAENRTNRVMVTEPVKFKELLYVWNTFGNLSVFDINKVEWKHFL